MPAGLVCGFRAEQRIAARITPLCAMAWRNPGAASDLVKQGATLLVSFGIAGALDPALRAGRLIIPSEIICPDGKRLRIAADIAAHLYRVFPDACQGLLYASETIVDTSAGKQELFTATGAAAVDMETAAMASIAQEKGLPWIVIRAIADEAQDSLPPAAKMGLKDNGNIDGLAVARSILKSPSQIPALMRTGRVTKAALATLDVIAPNLADVLK